MSKCFKLAKVVPKELLDDLRGERQHAELFEAEIYPSDKFVDPQLQPAIRSTKLAGISHRWHPEICIHLLSLLDDPSRYTIGEFNYLVYDRPGDHFKAHRDWSPTDNVRQYTIITMMHKDQLQGGLLQLWDDEGTRYDIDLEVGESIVFSAHIMHKVTKIENGSREVLVSWVWNR